MNVAVVGRSRVNSILKKKLEEEGFTPFLLDNIEEIIGFGGEKLDFTVRTSESNINAGYVIVTEELLKDNGFDNPDRITSSRKPVVFILDYPAESPAYFTVEALKSAIKLAKRKKHVLYLSRFMRTAGNQVESLYKEARNSGVNFIKYNDLSIDYDKDSAVYRITAEDGYDNTKIETTTVITEQSTAPKSGIERIAKLFHLKSDKNGSFNENKSFLFPSYTSRDGIYFINSASFTNKEEISDRILFIVSEIKNEINGSAEAVINEKHADISAGKCAFCYTCYRACPHSAMAPDYQNSVMKNLERSCHACGICASVCPADAIRIVGKESIKPGTGTKTLKILCCENSGEIAVQKLRDEFSWSFDEIEVVPVSCGGEISVEAITNALGQYEKVVVVTCMDEACKHFEGNKRAERFVEKVKEMLKVSGMDEKRVECLKISHAMPQILLDELNEMLKRGGLL